MATADATTITLPDGCFGLQMDSDGREFNARPGGTVDIPDAYLPELKNSNAARNGIIRVGRAYTLGTKRGKVCTRCGFRAQAWSEKCPRTGCGAPTREE